MNRSLPINGRVANVHSEGARFRSHRPADCCDPSVRSRRHDPMSPASGYPHQCHRAESHRPVAPQRHRERVPGTPAGTLEYDDRAGRLHWTSPPDNRSLFELIIGHRFGVWVAGALTAVGLLLAVYGLTVLAMAAGPGR